MTKYTNVESLATKVCKHCGKEGLMWNWDGPPWRLVEPHYGDDPSIETEFLLHTCKEYPNVKKEEGQ